MSDVKFHERAGMSLLLYLVCGIFGAALGCAATRQTPHYVEGTGMTAVVLGTLGFLYGALVWRRQPAEGRRYEDVTFRVNEVSTDGKAGVESKFATSPDALKKMAQKLNANTPFSEAAMCGKWGIMTRAEFVAVRAEMVRRGWAVQRGATPQRGYEITEHGWDMLRRLAR